MFKVIKARHLSQLTTPFLSSLIDCLWGPQFCLCGIQLLAATVVTTVTRVVEGGRDEQYKYFAVGCFGGGKDRWTVKPIL